jgi:TonB-dependent starch-binding outer membrane protein SusC
VVVDWQKGGSVINLTQFLYDAAQTSPDWGEPAGRPLCARCSGSIEPYIEDASFVKLREVAVGWTCRHLFASRWPGAAQPAVGLTGRNLFMWTEVLGLDPEVANFGAAAIRNNLDIAPYPPSRSIFLNISVGF